MRRVTGGPAARSPAKHVPFRPRTLPQRLLLLLQREHRLQVVVTGIEIIFVVIHGGGALQRWRAAEPFACDAQPARGH